MEIIWSYTGKYRTVSHAWHGFWVGQYRKALCGRLIKRTGDDSSVPSVECKDCRRLMKGATHE